MMRRFRKQLYALVGVLALSLTAPLVVFAQDAHSATEAKKRRKKKRASSAKRAQTPKRPKREAQAQPAQGPAVEGQRSAPSAQDAARAAAQEAAQGVSSEIVREGDTTVKVMEFSGLDIEGRLKSPQLLYFVNRVRAEFDRPRLPHRSFIPEIERSTQSEPLQ